VDGHVLAEQRAALPSGKAVPVLASLEARLGLAAAYSGGGRNRIGEVRVTSAESNSDGDVVLRDLIGYSFATAHGNEMRYIGQANTNSAQCTGRPLISLR